jgi:hypothetical protein
LTNETNQTLDNLTNETNQTQNLTNETNQTVQNLTNETANVTNATINNISNVTEGSIKERSKASNKTLELINKSNVTGPVNPVALQAIFDSFKRFEEKLIQQIIEMKQRTDEIRRKQFEAKEQAAVQVRDNAAVKVNETRENFKKERSNIDRLINTVRGYIRMKAKADLANKSSFSVSP